MQDDLVDEGFSPESRTHKDSKQFTNFSNINNYYEESKQGNSNLKEHNEILLDTD